MVTIPILTVKKKLQIIDMEKKHLWERGNKTSVLRWMLPKVL